MLTPAYIAALVERHHGQVIVTKREIYDAGLLELEVTENDRGEVVIRTTDSRRATVKPESAKPEHSCP